MIEKFIFLSCCICLPLVAAAKDNSSDDMKNVYMLVGTYTSGSSTGIYVYDLDLETGDMKYVGKSPDISNPSYLAVSADEKYVYAVCEDDRDQAAAVSFSFDKGNGRLELIHTEKTTGAHPCHVSVNKGNNFIAAANYTGGSLSVFPVTKNGGLLPVSQVFDFQWDQAPDSHIHTSCFSPDETFLFVTDLGKDKIFRYRVKPKAKSGLFLQEQSIASTLDTGSGPRHLSFHPNGNYLYCINELSGKIAVFKYINGTLEPIQTIVSDTTSGTNRKGSADIHLTPDGKFLYSSNRLKADGIAIFKVNEDGTLTSVGYQTTGIHPRNFIITPNGKFLLVASRNSNNVCVFSINSRTGLLNDTGKEIKIDQPVCLKLISPQP